MHALVFKYVSIYIFYLKSIQNFLMKNKVNSNADYLNLSEPQRKKK